ncbi:MAG TPA: hypothetical protein GX511_04055, partial [Firmicutes bacterium]|nr:hypothetical protein [Bacillota bacterium]
MELKITQVLAREVLDCRGNPTVQVDVVVNDEVLGRADVPAGKSTGAHEAQEVRDGGKRFGGLGVKKVIASVVEEIGPAIRGRRVTDQRTLDLALIALDGTPNKARLGANAILG